MSNNNTSATGGYLAPNTPYPLDDAALDNFLQTMVVNITGLPASYVRPRWQSTTPVQLEQGTNWCAIGIMDSSIDDGPYITYDPIGLTGTYTRHETLNLLASFYGPNSKQFAAILRDGIAVPQNIEVLLANAMAYVECGNIRNSPELINNKWIKRQDMSIVIRRKITRSYALSYLAASEINLIDDTTVNDTIIVPPGTTWSA